MGNYWLDQIEREEKLKAALESGKGVSIKMMLNLNDPASAIATDMALDALYKTWVEIEAKRQDTLKPVILEQGE